MITQQRIKELFDYNQDTGEFTYRVSRGNKKAGSRAGSIAGTKYKLIIDRVPYQAEEIAVIYVLGGISEAGVLFKDKDPLNLRWANLDYVVPQRTREVVIKEAIAGLKEALSVLERLESPSVAEEGTGVVEETISYSEPETEIWAKYLKHGKDMTEDQFGELIDKNRKDGITTLEHKLLSEYNE